MKKVLASAALMLGLIVTACNNEGSTSTTSDTSSTTISSDTLGTGGSTIYPTDTSGLNRDTTNRRRDSLRK